MENWVTGLGQGCGILSIKKDRAKRFIKYSIFDLQYSIPARPG